MFRGRVSSSAPAPAGPRGLPQGHGAAAAPGPDLLYDSSSVVRSRSKTVRHLPTAFLTWASLPPTETSPRRAAFSAAWSLRSPSSRRCGSPPRPGGPGPPPRCSPCTCGGGPSSPGWGRAPIDRHHLRAHQVVELREVHVRLHLRGDAEDQRVPSGCRPPRPGRPPGRARAPCRRLSGPRGERNARSPHPVQAQAHGGGDELFRRERAAAG